MKGQGTAAVTAAHELPCRRRVLKEDLKFLVQEAGRPGTNKLYRTVCGRWNEIEVPFVTDATTVKVEAKSTSIIRIKCTARGYRNLANYKSILLMRRASGLLDEPVRQVSDPAC